MEIEFVDESEFPTRRGRSVNRRKSELQLVMETMETGQVIRMDCQWKHSAHNNGCLGSSYVWQAMKRISEGERVFNTRCRDKMFFVRRTK
jgi:hypothetical protein